MPILPKHIWIAGKRKIAKFEDKKSIGSGPFKLKKFKSGEYIWMVKNEDYWGEKPHVDEVVFKGYGTEDAIKLAMKKGEVEFVGYSGVSPMSVKSYEKRYRSGYLTGYCAGLAHVQPAQGDRRPGQGVQESLYAWYRP
jgi:ABC-type transport system substrate-binding protein